MNMYSVDIYKDSRYVDTIRFISECDITAKEKVFDWLGECEYAIIHSHDCKLGKIVCEVLADGSDSEPLARMNADSI